MSRSVRWSAVWLLLAGAPALAQPSAEAVVESFALNNARALVTACSVPEGDVLYGTAKGFCLGFMTGAMQLYRAATMSPKVKNAVCPGREVSRAEMRDVFLEWAAANPERLDEPAVEGLMRAAVAKFPCQA